jgi:hypothetical protein
MGRKKNPANNYFHEGIEEAILKYNISQSELERNRLFLLIYPALAKIAEVYYNKIKPIYMDGEPMEIQMDCICFLTERLGMIKQGKGKAFSYMTVCAKNYYIFHNQRGYTGTKKTLKLDAIDENWDIAEDDFDRPAEMELHHDLINAFAEYIKQHQDKIVINQYQRGFLVELTKIMEEGEWIEGFTERNFIHYLAEKYPKRATTAAVRKMLNRLSYHYDYFKNKFIIGQRDIPYLKKSKLTKEEIEYCVSVYKPNNRTFGAIALGKKFNVDHLVIQQAIIKQLSKTDHS